MLFQVLCGSEPIFYTTHPNEEPEKGMFLYVYHKGVDKPRNNLIASFTNKQYFFIRMNVKGLLHCITMQTIL